MADKPADSLHFLLGSMHSDIKKLLITAETQSGRVSALEKRIGSLEKMRVRIGVFVTLLGVAVPTTLSYLLKKFGG